MQIRCGENRAQIFSRLVVYRCIPIKTHFFQVCFLKPFVKKGRFICDSFYDCFKVYRSYISCGTTARKKESRKPPSYSLGWHRITGLPICYVWEPGYHHSDRPIWDSNLWPFFELILVGVWIAWSRKHHCIIDKEKWKINGKWVNEKQSWWQIPKECLQLKVRSLWVSRLSKMNWAGLKNSHNCCPPWCIPGFNIHGLHQNIPIVKQWTIAICLIGKVPPPLTFAGSNHPLTHPLNWSQKMQMNFGVVRYQVRYRPKAVRS